MNEVDTNAHQKADAVDHLRGVDVRRGLPDPCETSGDQPTGGGAHRRSTGDRVRHSHPYPQGGDR